MSRSKPVGIVVSGEPPSWNSQSAAFAQGVKAENPDAKISYAVIGPAAYSDAAGGKRVTESVDRGGCRHHLRPGQRLKLRHAAGGRDDQGRRRRQGAISSTSSATRRQIDKGILLSSVVWNMTPVYSAMIADLKADTFGTKGYEIGRKDDSVSF